MKKYIEIGEHTFEVNKIARDRFAHYENINKAYGNPSGKKVKTYESWRAWSLKVGANGFGVCSKTCQFFTLACSVEHEGQTYRVYITPSYNYCYPI